MPTFTSYESLMPPMLEVETAPPRKDNPSGNGGMQVAFASLQAAANVRAWSGTIHFIAQALEQQGITLHHVDDLQRTRLFLNKGMNRIFRMAGLPEPMPIERSMAMARRFAHTVKSFAERGGVDLIFSPSSIPLALLDTPIPKVFYTDATFGGMVDASPIYGTFTPRELKVGDDLERAALANCDLAIYASQWAADTAITRYGADPAKVKVVPFGSNLDLQPGEDEVKQAIAKRPKDRCELLLLGVSWEGKGGPFALEVVRRLNQAGLPSKLTVVGCSPPADVDPELVRVIPFVNKGSATGQRTLVDLIMTSHFLILPSQAECFGIVYAEASSVGLPSLARLIQGVGEAVREGRNGHVFAPDASPDEYVAKIMELMADRAAYERLSQSAFHEHRQHLNWQVAGAALKTHIASLVRR